MKTLTINEYEELKNLSIKTLEENALEKGTYKSYTYYFIDTKPYYDICLIVVGNNKIIYIDEQLQYDNKLTTEQVKDKMLNIMKTKIFDLTEFSKVESYVEYLNKLNFLNNIYRHLYNSVSVYNNTPTKEEKSIKDKNFYANNIAFCYFENAEELEFLNILYKDLEHAIRECLQDEKQQEQAIEYEIYNHETTYTYNLTDIAFLIQYGITAQKIKETFNKVLKKVELY